MLTSLMLSFLVSRVSRYSVIQPIGCGVVKIRLCKGADVDSIAAQMPIHVHAIYTYDIRWYTPLLKKHQIKEARYYV